MWKPCYFERVLIMNKLFVKNTKQVRLKISDKELNIIFIEEAELVLNKDVPFCVKGKNMQLNLGSSQAILF